MRSDEHDFAEELERCHSALMKLDERIKWHQVFGENASKWRYIKRNVLAAGARLIEAGEHLVGNGQPP